MCPVTSSASRESFFGCLSGTSPLLSNYLSRLSFGSLSVTTSFVLVVAAAARDEMCRVLHPRQDGLHFFRSRLRFRAGSSLPRVPFTSGAVLFCWELGCTAIGQQAEWRILRNTQRDTCTLETFLKIPGGAYYRLFAPLDPGSLCTMDMSLPAPGLTCIPIKASFICPHLRYVLSPAATMTAHPLGYTWCRNALCFSSECWFENASSHHIQ